MMATAVLIVAMVLLITALLFEATGKGWGAFAAAVLALFVLAGWLTFEWYAPVVMGLVR